MIKPHPDFVRDGFNVKSQIQITFTPAALGDKVSVNGIDGQEQTNIPAGVQTGKVFKIKGKGIPHLNQARRGDHLVKVVVVPLPPSLNQGTEESFYGSWNLVRQKYGCNKDSQNYNIDIHGHQDILVLDSKFRDEEIK